MKNYTIKNAGNSKVAAALANQLLPGKAGELLIHKGFSQDSFCEFLAELSLRAATAGFDRAKLTTILKQVAAGNASQARQALGDCIIVREGEKEISLNSFWGKTEGVAKADLSLLGEL